MLSENEMVNAFLATNETGPVDGGWPGLERFGRAVEKLVMEKLLKERDPNGFSPHTPGAKLDADKPNCDLVFGGFSNALLEVVQVGTYGAKKYTDNGWKSVPNAVTRYRSAAYRHLLCSEFLDKESGLPHLAHAAWNCLAALELSMTTEEKYEEYNEYAE